jgi:Zn-dependent protease with chaperone function
VIEALALALAALLGVPHFVPGRRMVPAAGIALWMSVLLLRALLALTLAALVILYVPATQLFQLLTHWCLHAVIPFFTTHLGFSGHRLGDVAVLVPALVLAVSLVSAGVAAWRAARGVRRRLGRNLVGPGPDESLLIGGNDVILAAAGLRTPRVVVSAGALCALDDPELRAGLEHERGHIARRHRFLFLSGNLCYALARLIPGSRSALTRLQFHLERDADDYAVRRTGDPLALASAICKAATERGQGSVALAPLGGRNVSQRLDVLLTGETATKAPSHVARILSVALCAAAFSLILSAPAVAAVGIEQLQGLGGGEHLCAS